MINFFKKTDAPKTAAPAKSKNEVIQEIHGSFFTAPDDLLAQAKISKSVETTKQELIDKAARLSSLGFANTKEVQEAQIEIDRLNRLDAENQAKASMIRAIEHFSFRYPQYKFITEASVKKICAKYNLVYGNVGKYIGTVPDKNLKHIEDFKIKDEDKAYLEVEEGMFHYATRFIDQNTYSRQVNPHSYDAMRGVRYRTTSTSYRECPLTIVAPVSDFNMGKSELKDFQVSDVFIPDPIVLAPVFFEGQRHFLVVTAWGEEASDQDVVNQKMN